jgi:RNA polymerase-interacting CarD/CdnL/TRCF family regulator
LSEILRSPSRPLKIASKERQQQIKLLMQDGSPTALCTLMRDLTAHAARRAPNASDSAALEKVRGILVAEWALATQSPDAADQVNALLRQSALHDIALRADAAAS